MGWILRSRLNSILIILFVVVLWMVIGIGGLRAAGKEQLRMTRHHYQTTIRCLNCYPGVRSFWRDPKIKVLLPKGQGIMDPKSKCPKCNMSLAHGRK